MDIDPTCFYCIHLPLVLVLRQVFKEGTARTDFFESSIKLSIPHFHVLLFLLFTLYTLYLIEPALSYTMKKEDVNLNKVSYIRVQFGGTK